MTTILEHIQCLEAYLERGGARLMRTALPDAVHGRVFDNVITLRAGLRPAQELAALIHELAHWLVHGEPRPRLHCTVFEYEAEAVEALVMARLDPQSPGIEAGAFRRINPTDNLLPASVARVKWASTRICAALGLEAQPADSEAQSPVDLETAAGEEVVFEYEHYGMGDFLGLPEAL
jgi:hypothetical protein